MKLESSLSISWWVFVKLLWAPGGLGHREVNISSLSEVALWECMYGMLCLFLLKGMLENTQCLASGRCSIIKSLLELT